MKPISNAPKDPVARGGVESLSNPTFTEAFERANIASGESLSTIFGKIKKFFSDLKTVAFTNNYNDLDNKPTIPTVNNATLTIQKNGTTVKTFTANASSDVTCNIAMSKSDVGLGNVDNTADANKSVNYATSAGTAAKIDNIEFENNNSTGKNANNVTYNGHTYYSSNGPSTSLGASVNDGALYAQAYSDKWVGQIAQDYRNGRLFVRGKNNGTWQAWKRIANYDEIPTNTNQLTNGAGFITSSGTAKNVSGTVAIANGGTGATTRLKALENLTSEDVGTSAQYFLTITNSWGKGGYTSVENAKTVLGLRSAAYVNADKEASKNTIAQRDNNGHLKCVHLNTSNSAENINSYSGALVGFYSTDGWFRKTSKANFQSYLGLGEAAYINARNGAEANTACKRDSAGSIGVTNLLGSNSSNWLGILAAATACKNYANTAYAPVYASSYPGTSSRRFKENIVSMTDEEAKKILQVESVTFDYKANMGIRTEEDRYNQRGVIAEDVEKIIPYVVDYEEIENEGKIPYGVDYSKFVPYLIKMCQIQQNEINELREIINSK